MSADNGIYIAKFPVGYRVAEAQAIENIWYYPEGSVERKRILEEYFGDSPVFNFYDEALGYASRLVNAIQAQGELEYGIQYIGEL